MINRFENEQCSELVNFFSNRVLIPIPKSSPKQANVLWPSRIICDQLNENGHGLEVIEGVIRTEAVRKSAFSSASNRPTVAEHMVTLACTLDLLSNPKITLVDDVLTQGNTSVACAEIIRKTLPAADVRIFSVIRSQGFIPEIDKIVDPSCGTVKYFESGKVFRQP